ncbi:MAG: hypothetical protein WD509_01950 [Candidatus Paceibacterota bacterium]
MKYRRLVVVFCEELDAISQLFDEEVKYHALLNYLGNYKPQGYRLPNQKDLMRSLQLSRKGLMRLMNELYEEFSWRLGEEGYYPISETKIILNVHNSEYGWYIDVKGLKHIPKVGEEFNLYFIHRPYGSGLCKVESVDHDLSAGVHTITINLVDRYGKLK